MAGGSELITRLTDPAEAVRKGFASVQRLVFNFDQQFDSEEKLNEPVLFCFFSFCFFFLSFFSPLIYNYTFNVNPTHTAGVRFTEVVLGFLCPLLGVQCTLETCLTS